MTAAGGAAFTAPMRMVDRVHGDAAIMRLAAEPPVAAGLADRNVHVIRVGNRTDGAGAAAVNQPLLSRIQTHDDVVLVTADELRVGAGGTGKGAAAAARGSAAALKDLERRQRSRATRAQRDALDRALIDLAAYYRDVVVSAQGAELTGRVLAAPVRRGEPVTDVRVVGPGLWSQVPAGQVAAPVRLADLAVATLLVETLRGLDLGWPTGDFDVDVERHRLLSEEPLS